MEGFPGVSELKADRTKLDLGSATNIFRTKNSSYDPGCPTAATGTGDATGRCGKVTAAFG